MRSAANSALCSYVVAVFVCLDILCRRECVCACNLRIVLYVMGLDCILISPARFVQGELGGCIILGNDGKCSEACGIIWIVFCRVTVAKGGYLLWN